MNNQRIPKYVIDEWNSHCEEIQKLTTVNKKDHDEVIQKRVKKAQKDYRFFVEYYFPHYATCECADFHVKAANLIKKHKTIKALFKWFRGAAKSTHFDIFIPMWLKIQTPKDIDVMVLVSKSETMAKTLLGDLQADLESNQRYIQDFGIQKQSGSWEDGFFVTRDDTAFFARGRGQSPRGLKYKSKRPDYVVIDDFDDDELVQNITRVKKMVDWIKGALFGILDIGRGRFIMIGNDIHPKSVLSFIAKIKGVIVSQVNITDRNGNPTWEDKMTIEEIQNAQDFMGYAATQTEHYNNPIREGLTFKEAWLKYKPMKNLRSYDYLIAYCDPSFKDTVKSDYKAIKLWGKKGKDLHLIKAFVRQTSTGEMVRWFYDLHESLPEGVICDYYMEANFLQDIILDEFTAEGEVRGYQLPIRGDKRAKPNKYQRVEALAPLYERGLIYYNEDLKDDPDMKTAKDQLLAFGEGAAAHDDSPDADEGAIWMLQRRTRHDGHIGNTGGRSKVKMRY